MEMASAFQASKFSETLDLLEGLMSDKDLELREATRDALLAMKALFDEANGNIKKRCLSFLICIPLRQQQLFM